jgi:hypothetical protein
MAGKGVTGDVRTFRSSRSRQETSNANSLSLIYINARNWSQPGRQ